MPKALQHQLTIKTGHMQSASPISLDQREQGHLKSISAPHLCSINTQLPVVCVFNLNFDKVRCCLLVQLISSSTTSASLCSSVVLPYVRTAFLSVCAIYTPYLSDTGPLGSVLCGPFGFYYASHRSCHYQLDHRGAPSTPERILLNKKRSAICRGKWCYTAAQTSTAEMR